MRRKKGAVRHKECCPKSSFLCGLNGRITVVYHRVVIRCSNSATGVEIVKKERFRRGFCCGTIFQIKSTKNLIIGIKIRAKNEPIKATEIARIFLSINTKSKVLNVTKIRI